MSNLAVYTAVRSFLETNWDTSYATLAWENEEFVIPAGPWIFVTLDDSNYDEVSIGAGNPAANLWRETGAVQFRINVAEGAGTVTLDEIALILRTMMRGLSLPPSIRFDSMATIGRGRGEDGAWYGLWLRVGWISDDP